MDVKPGQYILMSDVTNPKPDRRQRYDWRAKETWYKGQEFSIDADRTMEGALRLSVTWDQYAITRCLYLHHDPDGQVAALLAALEPAPRTGARDLRTLAEPSHFYFAVMARLIDEKVIDFEKVKETVEQLNRELEEKDQAAN